MVEITHAARQTSRGGRRFVQAVLAIRGLAGRGNNASHHHVLNEVVATVQTELTALDHVGPQGRASSSGDNGLDRDACGFALQDGSGEAYNEEAFHYFLEIERKRSETSNRPFLLMLIEPNKHPAGLNPEIDVVAASKLFSILSRCLRETDFIGWYRDGRVAGAVLTQHGEPERDDLSEVVRRRVGEALEKHFPPDRPRGFQVRVYQLSPHATLRSES